MDSVNSYEIDQLLEMLLSLRLQNYGTVEFKLKDMNLELYQVSLDDDNLLIELKEICNG